VYVITHEFQKKCSIRFKSSNLSLKGQKVALPGCARDIPGFGEEFM